MSTRNPSVPSPRMLALLAVAAELRAGGSTWESVGQKMQRSAETCRRWPTLYPDQWNRLYREAEDRVLSDAGAEALFILRQLLRSQDDRVRRDVARCILGARMKLFVIQRRGVEKAREADDAEARRIARFLAAHSDAELEAVLGELLAAHAGRNTSST